VCLLFPLVAPFVFVWQLKSLEKQNIKTLPSFKNCNLLDGMFDSLIGCNFLFTFLLTQQNKPTAIPGALCSILFNNEH
jgi:hypothetical protein